MSVPVLDLKNPHPEPDATVATVAPEPGQEAGVLEPALLDEIEEMAWEAHHPLSDRGKRKQYLLLAGAVAVGGAVAFWQDSWATLLVVALAVAAWELRERLPKPTSVHIDRHGLTVDGLHYPHAELTSFDVHGMPDGTAELSVLTGRWHSAALRLPLGDQDPAQVRDLLMRYVPEARHRIPLVDWWLRS